MEPLGEQTSRIWTRREAVRAVGPSAVATQLRRGAWQVPWPGVYADAGEPLDPHRRAVAAVLASGGGLPPPGTGPRLLHAVAAGRTAARVHGFVLVDDADPATGADDGAHDDVVVLAEPPDLVVLDDGRRRVLHRHQWALQPGDVRLVAGGLHVTGRLRTIADCARLLRQDALVCLLDDALHRGLVAPAQLDALVAQHHARPGAVALRQAVAAADAGAESPAETLTRLLLLPVLPGLVPQVRIRDARGHVLARADLGDERLRLAVEADGRAGHEGEAMAAKDRRRDRSTDGVGWRTERFTWFELRRRPELVVASALQAARLQAERYGLPLP